ncbi:hypothetical protein PTE30175_02740 [Pandoraea terrae]|uniref:Transmembrane protein n=1 Tax=Pandoraea terrae TaxID=1537710 RepID=A0A5E4VU19_9BURK|nr:hypothetical protein [Pandoraea terrae]VVE14764.1 hypothetical protein PTE30175_02740 [Pandoraea terrae]
MHALLRPTIPSWRTTGCLLSLALAWVAASLPHSAAMAAGLTNTVAKTSANTRAAPKAAASKLPPSFTFAVLGDTPFSPIEEPSVRTVLSNIGESDAAFVVHTGNLKGPNESCGDAVLTHRIALLASSVKPLVYIPGANEWADCRHTADGAFNPVERLDFLRDHAFGTDAPLGQGTLDITRQSALARYRQYRENVRWMYNGIVFVGLNLPGNNNNYRTAGGRNGEFEDRVVATRVWLQHALVFAEQRKALGIVIFAQADPDFDATRARSGLRGLFSPRRHDGYAEFRSQLQKLASRFKAPILLIGSGTDLQVSQPLRDVKGNGVKHFTRVTTYGSPVANRWVRIIVDARASRLYSIDSAPTLARPAPAANASSVEGGR